MVQCKKGMLSAGPLPRPRIPVDSGTGSLIPQRKNPALPIWTLTRVLFVFGFSSYCPWRVSRQIENEILGRTKTQAQKSNFVPLYIDNVSLNPNTLNSLLSVYLASNNSSCQRTVWGPCRALLNHGNKIKSWFSWEVEGFGSWNLKKVWNLWWRCQLLSKNFWLTKTSHSSSMLDNRVFPVFGKSRKDADFLCPPKTAFWPPGRSTVHHCWFT